MHCGIGAGGIAPEGGHDGSDRCWNRTVQPHLVYCNRFLRRCRDQAFSVPGGDRLRRGSRNRLVHAEGAAFLVNPAAKL